MLKSLRRKIIGDLRANWGQFLAVWLVVTLGTTFYGAMYPAGVNMLNSIYRLYDDLHYMDFQVQFDTADPGVVEDVRTIPGVAHAEGRLIVESGVLLSQDQQYPLNLRLISLPDDGEQHVNRCDIMRGREVQADDEIVLLRAFANEHGIKPGDTLYVRINEQQVPLRVVGLAFNAEYLVAGRGPESPFPTPSTFGVAWMRYSPLAALAGREGEINDVVVHLAGEAGEEKPALKESVRAALADRLGDQPGVQIFSRKQTASGGVVDANINGSFPLMRFYSGLFLVGATLTTGILLARLVESERQRIGTMRALGVSRRELMFHYLTFGLIIGVTGGLVGSVLGYLNSFWVMNTFLSYLAGGPLPGYVNTPQVPFILLGFVIVVIGSTFAGAYPAWVQSGTPPGIALRPAAPSTPNVISRAQMRFLPTTLRRAVRNILRVPGRSLGTAFGVIAGAMMVFSALAMWDTMAVNFDNYFGATEFDLRVDMNAFPPVRAEGLENQVEQIARDNAGADVVAQGALVGAVTVVNAEGKIMDTVAVSLNEADPFFDLRTLEGSEAFSSAEGVWIGHNVQRVLNVTPGDMLTLRTPVFDDERPVKVLGVVSYAMGSPIFVPRGLATQWMGGEFWVNTALVRVNDGDPQAVRDALVDLPGMRAIEVVLDFEDDVNHYLEYYRVGTLIFGGFGYILTLAVLYNTVNGSLRERRGELAILRALGSTPWEIAVMVTIELLLMVAIGAVIGIPAGREVGFWLNGAYETDFFGQVNAISVFSYVTGTLSLLVIVLLAEIPGLRAVQRVDLGQVSKSQSF